MLGRKTFTQKEIDVAKASLKAQLAAYRSLAAAMDGDRGKAPHAAVAKFEGPLFNNLALTLDRYFVHRLRMTTGKDGTPLNELEMLADSLMNNGGKLKANNVIKYVPEKSVTKLHIGDQIRLTADDFERLSAGCFKELQEKFVK